MPVFLMLLGFSPTLSPPTPAPNLPTLTTAEQVHDLSYEEASRAYPVHLSRVQVLYYNSPTGNMFVYDNGRGIYLDMRDTPDIALQPGDEVEVDGVSGPGGFAPVVARVHVRVLGPGKLPPAPLYSLDHLLTGIEDGQWVAVEGVVRSVHPSDHTITYANQVASGGSNVLVTLATGAGRLDLIVGESGNSDYTQLIDAKVRVHGIAAPRFNQNRQLIGIHMYSPGFDQFQILEHPPADPFSLPFREPKTIMRYTPTVAPDHRIRVKGVVTALWPGRFLSIANADEGLFIGAQQTRDLHVGDRLDVVGFPAMGEYSPILEDVLYRKIGTSPLPTPLNIKASELFQGAADAQLVKIRGLLLKQTRTTKELTLLVTADDLTFEGILPLSTPTGSTPTLLDGSIVELTGTCYIEVFPNQTPESVKVLLRSSQDVKVVTKASWWTTEHALAALTVLFVAFVATFAWIALLRRRVHIQLTALETARAEAAAIDDLARAMQQVTAQRNLAARVSAGGSEHIAQLGAEFNRMLAELQAGDLATKTAEYKLQQQALTDELTGLPNRRSLADRLEQSLAVARREQRILAVLFLDLDGFKSVNDTLGHAVGDLLLIEVTRRLQSRLRQADTLARLGGDEFTVVLSTIRSTPEAEIVAVDLLEVLSQVFLLEGHEVVIGASIGISLFPQDGADAVTLMQQADSAMYAAKANGKNQVKSFTAELGSSIKERLSLESQLRGAMGRGEIHLHYQPEYDLHTHRLTRFEALARWTHPTLGNIPPNKFIAVAEDSGQIVALGAYILRQACQEARKWQDLAAYPIPVAVNVSSLQFSRHTFVFEVAQALTASGLLPQLLQIELAESIMLVGAERAVDTMTQLRALGISLAIDDFGTGYSCLSYLSALPFDTLKIDRSFVRDLVTEPAAQAILTFLIELAHSLNMQVVVEGVETPQQLEVVKLLNGNEVQGFLVGRPMPDPRSLLRANPELMRFEIDWETAEVPIPFSPFTASNPEAPARKRPPS